MAQYMAYSNSKSSEVQASNLWDAKQKALAYFKPRKSQQNLVAVVLVQKDDGTQVTVSTAAV